VAKNPRGERPDWWPREPTGYVFLAHVVEKIGRALHGDDWTGEEATTEDIKPLPRNLKDALYVDRQRADILLSKHRRDLKRPDFVIGHGAHEFTGHHWKIARELAQRLHDQGRAPLRRLEATHSEIARKNEAGELDLKIRPTNGGPWRDFQTEWWGIKNWRSHFDSSRIDPDCPNGDRPSWKPDNDHWIFATSRSVERLVLKQLGETKLQPHPKPTSEAEFADFMETYEGPRTELALTKALKDAGKWVTRARIRAALGARRRGRLNKSPK
jgi:hypothetical protein